MKKLIILGGSGIGMIAASVAETMGKYEVCGFLNDSMQIGTQIGKYKKFKVIGKTEDIEQYIKNGYYFFIAYVGLQNEKETFQKTDTLPIPNNQLASLIHPSAQFPDGYCKIGKGVLFAPLAQISPDTTISSNCILLANSFVGHDSFLDKFAHVATNGVVGANVHVGKSVHIGSNATIREKIRIGNYSLVGAGSVVLKDVPENTVVVGNPARILTIR
jgi:acetyltransferase EpsM